MERRQPWKEGGPAGKEAPEAGLEGFPLLCVSSPGALLRGQNAEGPWEPAGQRGKAMHCPLGVGRCPDSLQEKRFKRAKDPGPGTGDQGHPTSGQRKGTDSVAGSRRGDALGRRGRPRHRRQVLAQPPSRPNFPLRLQRPFPP